MTALTSHASYGVRPVTDRDFLIGAAVLLAVLCCSIIASIAPYNAAAISDSSWLFFP
jgi:hypothetical protein